jgi:hypothetical protein
MVPKYIALVTMVKHQKEKMYITYTNRKGEIHFLKAALTNKAAVRYYIVKNAENVNKEDLVMKIPAGFEFYEFPEDGKVVFQKKQKSVFEESEKKIVEDVLKQQNHVKDHITNIEKDAIVIYIAFLDENDFKFDLDHFRKIQSYSAQLRIIKENKIYQMQRFCKLWSNYGWITIEMNSDLEFLCNKFCPHLGKESLLEFWIEGEKDW